jgi:hypothetical protein
MVEMLCCFATQSHSAVIIGGGISGLLAAGVLSPLFKVLSSLKSEIYNG